MTVERHILLISINSQKKLSARERMTYQIGQIFRVQLVHYVSAVDFDCPGRDAKLVRNNLVLMTLDQKIEYFFFPVGECFSRFLSGKIRFGGAHKGNFQGIQQN